MSRLPSPTPAIFTTLFCYITEYICRLQGMGYRHYGGAIMPITNAEGQQPLNPLLSHCGEEDIST